MVRCAQGNELTHVHARRLRIRIRHGGSSDESSSSSRAVEEGRRGVGKVGAAVVVVGGVRHLERRTLLRRRESDLRLLRGLSSRCVQHILLYCICMCVVKG